MIDGVFVFDDIIDINYQNEIKKLLLGNEQVVNWFYNSDITNSFLNKQQRPGFSHNFVIDSKEVSPHNKTLIPLIETSCRKINFNITSFLKGRSFLQLPLNLKSNELDVPHIDLKEEHLVVLYYVNDSDGDTVIYKQKYNQKENKIPYMKDMEELKRITPKQGRVIMFNGDNFHTAQQPIKNVRCIVNYNII